MKALTLYQPWATLVAIGAKKIETRSWSTKYRGPLAIHAGMRFNREIEILCLQDPFRAALKDEITMWGRTPGAYYNLPFGAIVAICNLDGVWIIKEGPLLISDQEKTFGDYTPGRYMWMLEDIKRIEKPYKVKGKMGLWEWNELPEVKK